MFENYAQKMINIKIFISIYKDEHLFSQNVLNLNQYFRNILFVIFRIFIKFKRFFLNFNYFKNINLVFSLD